MRAFVISLVTLAGCAVDAPARGATHPANPAAVAGRLAGPPAALRAGVVAYPDVPALRAPSDGGHEHHHHAPD